jgi:hypothetical protein
VNNRVEFTRVHRDHYNVRAWSLLQRSVLDEFNRRRSKRNIESGWKFIKCKESSECLSTSEEVC